MKEKEVLIKVEGLSKKYCKDLKTSLWYGVKDLIAGITGNHNDGSLRKKEFWAVRDISFELKRGECLGLIGHNGAGKSTLLKILNGLINPDHGKVTIKGRVGALIELGAGFNPILSGRENVYNNGAILGFTKKEIDSKLEEIVAFAELEEFIDMPVQNYSSGMKVRLGFAVAAHMEPDVLLIDEVLAVGDLGFVLKCFKTIDATLPNTAIVFVSHNMPIVSRICNRIILMDHGKSKYQGSDVGKAIDKYYKRFSINESNIVFTDKSVKLKSVQLLNQVNDNLNIPELKWGGQFKLKVELEVLEQIDHPMILISVFDKEQRPVALFEPNKENSEVFISNNCIRFILTHENIQISKGIYTLNIMLEKRSTNEPIIRINNAMQFQIIHNDEIWPPFLLQAEYEFKNKE